MEIVEDSTSPYFMYSLVGTMSRLEGTAARQLGIAEEQFNSGLRDIKSLEEQKTAKLQELFKSAQAQQRWSLISSVTQYAISGVSLLTGLASLQAPESRTGGMFLIASSVAGIAAKVLSSTGVFKKVASWVTGGGQNSLQEKIASRLETGTTCISAGLGLYGAISAFRSGEVTGILEKMRHTTSGLLFGKSVVDFQKSQIEGQTNSASAFIQKVESLIVQSFQGLRQICKDGGILARTVGELCESIKQAISTLHRNN